MTYSNTPCAACKLMRRKCTRECAFAPYFPPDQPKKFICIHKIFGASSVAKLLSELPSNQREDVVTSLVYEAEIRIQTQQQTQQMQFVPQAHEPQTQTQEIMLQTQQQPHFMSQTYRPSSSSASVLTQQQQQHLFEAQDLEASEIDWQHNEMFRVFEEGGSSSSHDHRQSQTQSEMLRFNSAFDIVPTGSVDGYNQLPSSGTTVTGMSPSLALGGNYDVEAQLFMPTQSSQPQQQHHEVPLFMPSQPSQPLPFQTQETQTSSESDEEGS